MANGEAKKGPEVFPETTSPRKSTVADDEKEDDESDDESDESDGDGDHRIEMLLREMRTGTKRFILVKWQVTSSSTSLCMLAQARTRQAGVCLRAGAQRYGCGGEGHAGGGDVKWVVERTGTWQADRDG